MWPVCSRQLISPVTPASGDSPSTFERGASNLCSFITGTCIHLCPRLLRFSLKRNTVVSKSRLKYEECRCEVNGDIKIAIFLIRLHKITVLYLFLWQQGYRDIQTDAGLTSADRVHCRWGTPSNGSHCLTLGSIVSSALLNICSSWNILWQLKIKSLQPSSSSKIPSVSFLGQKYENRCLRQSTNKEDQENEFPKEPHLNGEKEVNRFVAVVPDFLGNYKTESSVELIETLAKNYDKMCLDTSHKLHILSINLLKFKGNTWGILDFDRCY